MFCSVIFNTVHNFSKSIIGAKKEFLIENNVNKDYQKTVKNLLKVKSARNPLRISQYGHPHFKISIQRRKEENLLKVKRG